MTQRKPMEVTFGKILKAYDCREQFEKAPSGGFSLVINRGENYLPLSVFKSGPNRVAICHFYIQAGDLMRDPEIVFDLETWKAVESAQDSTGYYEEVAEGYYSPGIETLARHWAKNIRLQGFCDPSKTTHVLEVE